MPLQLRDQQLHPPVAGTHLREPAFGIDARRALGVDLAAYLQGVALDLGEARAQLQLARGAQLAQLGGGGLFCLVKLALRALQALGEARAHGARWRRGGG